MLDRGQTNDWFSSRNPGSKPTVAGRRAVPVRRAHADDHAQAPSSAPALFKDRNFLTGNIFIFMVGVVLFATLALMPPLLQGLLNYPVVLTGLVTAPRGVGTLRGHGRRRPADRNRIDTRYIIAVGFAMTARLALADDPLLAADGRSSSSGPACCRASAPACVYRAARGDRLRHAVAGSCATKARHSSASCATSAAASASRW